MQAVCCSLELHHHPLCHFTGGQDTKGRSICFVGLKDSQEQRRITEPMAERLGAER